MATERDLETLLSTKYDPAYDNSFRFKQAYNQIAKYRDDLCKHINAKEQKRADIRQAEASGADSGANGSRFCGLRDNDSGSTISPPTKYTFSACLTAAQLDGLTFKERKTEVTKIQRDIRLLEEAKKGTKAAAAAESKERSIREEARKKKGQEEAKEEGHDEAKEEYHDEIKQEDHDVASESELAQGWETVKRRVK